MQLDNYRACSPGETLTRVSPFLHRLGITRLARQTGLDDIGIAVWCAFAPNAKAIVIAQGKGIDDEAARTSAAMEAVERSVATNPTCEHRITTRQRLKDAREAVDIIDILLSPHAPSIAIDEEVDWVCATDLLNNKPIWLPFDAVHLDCTVTSPRYWQSSDGLASGNTRNEALLHAVLERVERDALTLWEMTPIAKRYKNVIDHASISQPALRDALGRVAQADLEIVLFDITTDMEIPCVFALLGPRDRPSSHSIRHVELTYGAGAATTPAVAAMRAITEAAQSRMTFIAGARDDLLPGIFSQRAELSMLQAMNSKPSRSLSDLPALDSGSTERSLQTVLQRLQSKGIDKLYAVDLAPDWLPASVVKVFAPQLENPDGERHRRFGPRALSRSL